MNSINLKVKKFVRDKMGCKCPEEVFEHIEVEKNLKSGYVDIDYKINVGNRLLIYVVDGSRYGTEENIRNLILAGVKERDDRNFNRFRLVLVDKEPDERKYWKFMKTIGLERTHIHFLKKSDLFEL
ncbi:MAG TPA: hypothetical protein EYP30_06545 [Archaeoglobaceae archaeon]|nr:hypothetical protein [Archaeoglobaceae archaeon]